MHVGLMWYDKDPKISFVQKIEEAAERYRDRFGVEPNTCYVNPTTLPEGAVVPGLELRVRPTIRPHHLWIGVAPDAPPAPRPDPAPAVVEPAPIKHIDDARPRRKR